MVGAGGAGSGWVGADGRMEGFGIAAAGGIKMIGDSVSQWANTLVTSTVGSNAGTIFSSLLSGATSGAAMGSLAGPIGTVIGAAIGGSVGLLNGGNQVFQK